MMDERICKQCGAVLSADAAFCVECGSKAFEDGSYESPPFETPESYATGHTGNKNVYGAPLDDEPVRKKDPGIYAPIGTWEFVGIHLLLLIPFANIILLIVWACGGCRRINLRNFARSKLLMCVIFFVLFVILCALFASWFARTGFERMNELESIIEYYTA